MPEAVVRLIPSQEDTADGYGGSHPGLTSLEETSFGETVAVFEVSLNQWPPVARIMMAVWKNDITEGDVRKVPVLDNDGNPIVLNYNDQEFPVTRFESDKFLITNVMAQYNIGPFNFNPPMNAKLGVTREPKPLRKLRPIRGGRNKCAA